ncbi:MAG: hypothetical protein VKN33_03320 [Candidatus Sericytochromatia bacterium]|nr:hypothetical protein [Candidatus Sericytochromatia bacterium]
MHDPAASPPPSGAEHSPSPASEDQNWGAGPAAWSLHPAPEATWEGVFESAATLQKDEGSLQAAWEQEIAPPESWRLPQQEPVWDFAVASESQDTLEEIGEAKPFEPLAHYPDSPSIGNQAMETVLDQLQPPPTIPQENPDAGLPPEVDGFVQADELGPTDSSEDLPLSAEAEWGLSEPAEEGLVVTSTPWNSQEASTAFFPIIEVPAQSVAEPFWGSQEPSEPGFSPAAQPGREKAYFLTGWPWRSGAALASGSVAAALAILFWGELLPSDRAEHVFSERLEFLVKAPPLAFLPGAREPQSVLDSHHRHARAVENALKKYVATYGRYPGDIAPVEHALEALGVRLQNPYDRTHTVMLTLGARPSEPGGLGILREKDNYFIYAANRRGEVVSNGSYDWILRGDVAGLYRGAAPLSARWSVAAWPPNVPWQSPLLMPPKKPEKPSPPYFSAQQLAVRHSALRGQMERSYRDWHRRGVAHAYDGNFVAAEASFRQALIYKPDEPTALAWLQRIEPVNRTAHRTGREMPSAALRKALQQRDDFIRQKMREVGSWEQSARVSERGP